MTSPETTAKPSRFPHSLVLIFGMIILAQIATYFITPGEFTREGKKVVAGTYKTVEAEALPWHAAFTSVLKTIETETGSVILFVFLVGGVIAILRATGAIDALIGSTIRKIGHQPILLVAVMLALFAVGSSTIGMAEEYMPFIPILVGMCIALKMDAIVAMGIVYIGAGVGYGCAAYNPFTIGIAKDVAGQPLEFGALPRWGLLAVMLAIGTHHILRYARKVRANPSFSYVANIEYGKSFEMPEDTSLTPPRALILAAFVAMLGVFVWGASVHEWYFTELSGLFLGLGVVAALVGGLTPNKTADVFCAGAAEMTTTALLIGFARTIEVVLDEAVVKDTIINGIAQSLEGMSAGVAATSMLFVQSICNFLVPSGSGQAYVTMPIMSPLADLTGVGRETAILAYQFGDGLTNMLVPTNALLMGMLALGKIPYGAWLKFIVPFLIKVYIIAIIALVIAANVQWQAPS